jgi:acrylyl-CoA reductase (NADPH)
MCPMPLREKAWARLATDLDASKLTEITREIVLDDVIEAGAQIIGGKVRGRVVVRVA